MHVIVDRRKCLKSGQCTYLHPEIFREDESGYPVALVDDLKGDLLSGAEEAAEICPAQAISVAADEAAE